MRQLGRKRCMHGGIIKQFPIVGLREYPRGSFKVLRSRLLAVYGTWQRDVEERTGKPGEVRHLIAKHLRDLTPLQGELATQSREFH